MFKYLFMFVLSSCAATSVTTESKEVDFSPIITGNKKIDFMLNAENKMRGHFVEFESQGRELISLKTNKMKGFCISRSSKMQSIICSITFYKFGENGEISVDDRETIFSDAFSGKDTELFLKEESELMLGLYKKGIKWISTP